MTGAPIMIKPNINGVRANGDWQSQRPGNNPRKKFVKYGSGRSKEVDFQVDILTLTILNALKEETDKEALTNWKLSTDNKLGGRFGDVVLETLEGDVLIRTKLIQNNNQTITVDQLMSTKSPFSLLKCYESYVRNIQRKFKNEKLIICTNAHIDDRALECLEPINDVSHGILYYPGYSVHKFKDTIFDILKTSISENYTEQELVSANNISNFLNNLHLYINYPSNEVLRYNIEHILSENKYSKNTFGRITYLELFAKVKNWYKQNGPVYYLNETLSKLMFIEILRDKYFDTLEKYDISLCTENLNFQQSKVLHIVADENQLLHQLRLWNKLKDYKNSTICIHSRDNIEIKKDVIRIFQEKNDYKYLIIIFPKIPEDSKVRSLYHPLENFINESNEKKIIILADANNILTQSMFHNVCKINTPLKCEKVFANSGMLSNKNLINYQGRDISLSELLGTEKLNGYIEELSPCILEKLLKGEKIIVGLPLVDLDDGLCEYYINRKFIKAGTTFNEEELHEELMKDCIVIADNAGCGKSTVLKKLALSLKGKNPDVWVITVDLKEYTQELEEVLENNKSVDLLEFLERKHKFNSLEKLAFSIESKVVLMLDSIDDIYSSYPNIIQNLLKQCTTSKNVNKIYIATRPHIVEELTETLDCSLLSLQPFDKENLNTFFTNYWTHLLKLDRGQREKCEKYAREVLKMIEMYLTTKSDPNFINVPLHAKVLADMFQEHIDLQTEELELPDIDIAKLFDLLIEKKRSIFLEKAKVEGNVVAKRAVNRLFDQSLDQYICLALKEVFERNRKLFTSFGRNGKAMNENDLKIGFIQRVGKKISFVHRSFAEYFAANCLVEELRKKQNSEIQNFFITHVLQNMKYKRVRAFVDSILKSTSNSVNVFQNFTHSSLNWLIYVILADEGLTTILNMLFEFEYSEDIIYKKIPTLTQAGQHFPSYSLQIQKKRKEARLHSNEYFNMIDLSLNGGVKISIVNYNNTISLSLSVQDLVGVIMDTRAGSEFNILSTIQRLESILLSVFMRLHLDYPLSIESGKTVDLPGRESTLANTSRKSSSFRKILKSGVWEPQDILLCRRIPVAQGRFSELPIMYPVAQMDTGDLVPTSVTTYIPNKPYSNVHGTTLIYRQSTNLIASKPIDYGSLVKQLKNAKERETDEEEDSADSKL